jgi:hypothetical protein
MGRQLSKDLQPWRVDLLGRVTNGASETDSIVFIQSGPNGRTDGCGT